MTRIIVAVVFIAVSVVTTAAQASNLSFREYGLTFARPNGWFEVERKVLDDSVSQLELSSSGREKLKKDDNEATLLALFTRYVPDTRRGINPKIEVRVVPTGTSKPLSFENFQSAYNAASGPQAEGRMSYSFLQEPTVIEVVGGKGVFQITRFTIRTNNRTEYYIRSRTLAIPHNNYYFLIGVVDELGGDDLTTVFDELVKSIKIGNHN